MTPRLLPLALVLLSATPASAADRVFSIGSYDRVRVDGPFEVRIVTGTSPGAKASGDRQLLERLAIAVNGTTLTVRIGTGGWGETPLRRDGSAPVVTLSTPRLTTLFVTAGAQVRVDRMKAQRIDLSITGSGRLAVAQADTDQLYASILGAGSVTLGGRANRARLLTDGAGTMDATDLAVNDLTVRLDGPGETRAAARYTAAVTSTGLGSVTVTGKAKCTVQASAGGPVRCGEGGGAGQPR